MLVSLAILLVLVADSVTASCSTAGSGLGSLSLSTDPTCAQVVAPAFGFGRADRGPFFDLSTGIFVGGGMKPTASGTADPNSAVFSVNLGAGATVSMDGHQFTTTCFCDTSTTCPAVDFSLSVPCEVGSFAIKHAGGTVCLKFGEAFPASADNVGGENGITGSNLVGLTTAGQRTVSINGGTPVAFEYGGVATSHNGNRIQALVLGMNDGSEGLFFSACGPFVVNDGTGTRKRALSPSVLSASSATLVPASAIGDPHLAGANAIKLDVYGKPAANYSLVVAPSFEINMQLANRGPALRFMTAMSVLYRGTSFTITAWTLKTKRAELIAHFESLGAKVSFEGMWRIKIELCAAHTIEFEVHHTAATSINYLDFAMTVPGCHDAYGGLLGQTYQCKFATEKFEWSRDREEEFRVPTLETPSGSYSATSSCATEDEYRGDAMRGNSVGGDSMAVVAAQRV